MSITHRSLTTSATKIESLPRLLSHPQPACSPKISPIAANPSCRIFPNSLLHLVNGVVAVPCLPEFASLQRIWWIYFSWLAGKNLLACKFADPFPDPSPRRRRWIPSKMELGEPQSATGECRSKSRPEGGVALERHGRNLPPSTRRFLPE